MDNRSVVLPVRAALVLVIDTHEERDRSIVLRNANWKYRATSQTAFLISENVLRNIGKKDAIPKWSLRVMTRYKLWENAERQH